MVKKTKKKNKAKKKKKFSILSPKTILVLITIVTMIFLYMAPAILFFIGMLPTAVVYFIDTASGKSKTLTIGALNFAACFHYMMKIWTHHNPANIALEYLENPKTLIVIYLAAALGYMINYGVTVLVSSVLKQKSEIRLNKIEEAKKRLIERWGEKVDGKKPLDPLGFPIQTRESVD